MSQSLIDIPWQQVRKVDVLAHELFGKRGVDRRQFDLVRGVHHTDAMDYYVPYNGNIDGLIQMTHCHEGVAQSMHLLDNCLMYWRGGDVALVETYSVTYQRLKPGDGGLNLGC